MEKIKINNIGDFVAWFAQEVEGKAIERHPILDIAKAYQEQVDAGTLPDTGLIWRVARAALAALPEDFVTLRDYAATLCADNHFSIARYAESVGFNVRKPSDKDLAKLAAWAAYAAHDGKLGSVCRAYTSIRGIVICRSSPQYKLLGGFSAAQEDEANEAAKRELWEMFGEELRKAI